MRSETRLMDARNTMGGKVVATLLSLLLVLSFLSTTTFVNRAYADGEEESTPEMPVAVLDEASEDDAEAEAAAKAAEAAKVHPGDVHGVDFMTPNGQDGYWDLFRVENGSGKTIYIEVEKNGQTIAPRFAYQIVEGQNIETNNDDEYAGSASQRIAQVVALKFSGAAGNFATDLQEAYGNAAQFPHYVVKVYDAKRQGTLVYRGAIWPIYAKLVNSDQSEEWKVLGIRTIDDSYDSYADTVGAGATYYKGITGDKPIAYESAKVTSAGEPIADRDRSQGRYVVTYQQVASNAISGAVKYVDEQGSIVETEVVENIGEGKTVTVKKSFFTTTTNQAGEVERHYYRVIQRLNGSTILLTPEQSTKQIRVMEVKSTDAGAYPVTIRYVDENGTLLWSDSVDVKGKGYQYTLPNTFSMSALKYTGDSVSTDRTKDNWGVNFYTLDSWTIETNAANDNEAISAFSVETQKDTPVVGLDAGSYPNGRTVTAKYLSQDATKEVALTIVEVNGVTGDIINRVQYKVTPDISATYTPAPKDGLVPWSGNMDPITYAWEDLEKGTDVLQYVYYVPGDYLPGDTYDITVQYMNIANSEILRSETITIDPETNDFVEILGEERFSQDGETYVRLAGQETAIRHAYFSSARTYTIYYRNVNDEISANITIRRTQIVDTERPAAAADDAAMTAVPVPVAAPAADGAAAPGVDAGVGAGDAQAVINDDDNPLANLGGQDTATERAIQDEETPLGAGTEQEVGSSATAVAIGLGIAALAGAALFFWWIRRRKRNEQAAAQSINE